ncbi:MAG: OmpA family protein [Bacteroidota bacterium]
MKTVITGLIVFIIWSVLSTLCYVSYVKGSPPDESTQAVSSTNDVAPAAVEPEPLEVAPEPAIESPGSYTVFHEFDRSEIIVDDKFESYIDRAESYEDQTGTASLNVIGHTDHAGSEDYNYRLGLRRAESTRDYLVRNGISEQKITVSSQGESSPVATNGTTSGRAQNRRTEIQVVN